MLISEEYVQPQIYCDLDGVLCDFEEYVYTLLGEYPNKMDSNELWDGIDKLGSAFWEKLPWTPNGKMLWSFIKSHNPIILSALPKEGCQLPPAEAKWLEP